MHIFVINLKRCPEKKQYMLEQLNQLNLTAEFIEAVDGQEISQETLDSLVYDFENSYLTKNEVGCALSHLTIYQIMIEKNIKEALILEDDVILSRPLKELLDHISANINHKKSTLITLGSMDRYFSLITHSQYQNFKEFSAITSVGAHAYILNNQAAKSLAQHLKPIKYEADLFRYFQENGWIKRFHVLIPAVIHRKDPAYEESSIHKERSLIFELRRAYFKNQILKKRPIKTILLAKLKKILFRPFVKKGESELLC